MKNEKIIEARKKSGLTQKQVAEKINVSETSYQRIEYGRQRPRLETAISLAEVLSSSVEKLWGGNLAAK